MSTGTGTNVSKDLGYALLEPPAGANVSKDVGYAILEPPPGLNVSKDVAYVLLEATNTNPPVWPPITFANGVVGVAYSQSFDLTPAASPTTFTLASGSLPPGLNLSNVGGDIGAISGTPTTAGTFTFTLTATNAYGSSTSGPLSITIVSPPGSGGNYGYMF